MIREGGDRETGLVMEAWLEGTTIRGSTREIYMDGIDKLDWLAVNSLKKIAGSRREWRRWIGTASTP